MEITENILPTDELARKEKFLIDEINKGINSPRSTRTFEEITKDVKKKYLNNELKTFRPS